MAQLAHYAESFCCLPGQCFRLIQAETGHAQHCPYIPEWRGRFQDAKGKWYTVKCNGHRADLDPVQRIHGSPPHRSELPWRH
jgi:hypothetical protein